MEIARHWRLKQQRYGLVGEICPHCSAKIFPPRDICLRCGGEIKVVAIPMVQRVEKAEVVNK
jgi:uncharacterized OB-fold protein